MMMYELRGSNAVHDILYLFFFQSSFFNVFCFTSFLEDFFPSVTHYSFLKVFTKNFKLRCFYFWRPETGSAGDFTYSLPGSCAIKFNMADNVQFLDLTPSQKWEGFENRMKAKREINYKRKQQATPKKVDHLTVQRLSSDVSGKAQKFSRIGPREFVS